MKKAMISMKKAKRGVVSFAVIFAMLLSICSFTAMADSTDPTCYADVDEIVLTYPDTAPTDITPVLKKDGVVVPTTSTTNENTVVIKPATGNFERDVLYELTAGTFSQYFKIKTLVNGIAETDVTTYDGPKGGKNSATVFIDSDNDGVKEMYHYNNNGFISFKDNEINTALNYTVKYTLSSYAIVTDENGEPSKNAKGEYDYYNKVISILRWNAPTQSPTAATAGIQLANANWQPIKYLSGTDWVVSKVTVADAGLGKFGEKNNKVNPPVNHGKILYDNGASDIKVLQQPGVHADIKLKKLAKAGTLYIDGVEKYTTSSTEATTGYFFFGGGEGSMHNFIGIKNFVATTYEPVIEIKPVSYYGDKDAITVTFDNDVVSADKGTITVKQGTNTVATNVSVADDVVTVTPVSGEFARDVESKITISSGFGSESNFTKQEYTKAFKIKTVQDTISEDTFGTKSSKKVYKGGTVYFQDTSISPLKASPSLSDYSISFKFRPFLADGAKEDTNGNLSLYMRMYFNNETAASAQSNKGSAWNFQNYEQFISHINWKEADDSYKPDWEHQYGQWADTGLPNKDDLETATLANDDVTFSSTPTYNPVDVKINKSGKSGTMTIGSVTDTLETPNNTGYFVIAQYFSPYSVIEVSEFIMTTFEEVVGDVSLSNATATKDANSVTLRYDINKGGDDASYPVWIVAAAYDSSHRLLGTATSSDITLTQTLTNQSVTISNVDTSKIEEIKIFTWDTSSSITPYGAPTPVSIPTN